MPSSWSNKDERKYEHIKEGYEERGASEDRAGEIAARTKDELENVAAKEDVEGRSRMSKSELVDAIRRKR